MITLVVSITDYKSFHETLGKSLSEEKTPFHFVATQPYLLLPESYETIRNPPTEYIAFIDQDMVFLEDGHWLEKAEQLCNSLPKLGVAGLFGATWDRKKRGYVVARYTGTTGYVEYYGKKYMGMIVGKPFNEPMEVAVLDGMFMMVPTEVWRKQKLDPKTFPFHGMGEDFCLAVIRNLGLKNYALPLKTYEVSLTSWTKEYYEKHGRGTDTQHKLKKKWGAKAFGI